MYSFFLVLCEHAYPAHWQNNEYKHEYQVEIHATPAGPGPRAWVRVERKLACFREHSCVISYSLDAVNPFFVTFSV